MPRSPFQDAAGHPDSLWNQAQARFDDCRRQVEAPRTLYRDRVTGIVTAEPGPTRNPTGGATTTTRADGSSRYQPVSVRLRRGDPGWAEAMAACMGAQASDVPPTMGPGVCEASGECCATGTRCGFFYDRCGPTYRDALNEAQAVMGSGGLCGSLRRNDRRASRTEQRIVRRTARSDFRQEERNETRDVRQEQREQRDELREERQARGGGFGGFVGDLANGVGSLFGAGVGSAAKGAAPTLLLLGAAGIAAYLVVKGK